MSHSPVQTAALSTKHDTFISEELTDADIEYSIVITPWHYVITYNNDFGK